eukprot:4879241-Prymnesium_polylepis.2
MRGEDGIYVGRVHLELARAHLELRGRVVGREHGGGALASGTLRRKTLHQLATARGQQGVVPARNRQDRCRPTDRASKPPEAKNFFRRNR